MSVTLDTTADGRVAVLHGVESDAALRHLGRSLLVGSAFTDVPGFVIDLGGARPPRATADLLLEASQGRMRQHQVVVTAATQDEVAAAVTRVRHGIDRLEHSATKASTVGIARDLAALRSVFDAGISIAWSVFSGCAGVVRRRTVSR